MLNFSVSIPIDELYLFRSDEMTDSRLMRGDDLYTSFNLSFSFPFYEENHTTLYVRDQGFGYLNIEMFFIFRVDYGIETFIYWCLFLQVYTNGVLSFGEPFIFNCCPWMFPLYGDYQLIAPFWADVDTTGTGDIWYRETTDANILTRANEDVLIAFPHYENYQSKSVFIVTWDGVGYYDNHTDRVRKFCLSTIIAEFQ